jgi:hypothetical protein
VVIGLGSPFSAWPANPALPLLNEPVDISGDFRDFSNLYYLADRVVQFDPYAATSLAVAVCGAEETSTARSIIVATSSKVQADALEHAFESSLAFGDPANVSPAPPWAMGQVDRAPDLDVLLGFQKPPPGFGVVPFYWFLVVCRITYRTCGGLACRVCSSPSATGGLAASPPDTKQTHHLFARQTIPEALSSNFPQQSTAKQLQKVVRQAYQVPLAHHISKASQQKLPKATHLFDLPENRLDYLLAFRVHLSTLPRPQLASHKSFLCQTLRNTPTRRRLW